MRQEIILSFLFLLPIIALQYSFAEKIESEYGEYLSNGNVWVEITHSVEQPPPWIVWKGSFHNSHSNFLDKISSEFDLAKKFFEQFDIELKDLISSNKNQQLCEALGCLFGTYHLLVPNEDSEKFQGMDYGYMISKSIPPKKQQEIFLPFLNHKIICKPELESIFRFDNSPACVKPESIPKLIERGWAKTIDSEVPIVESLQACSRIPMEEIQCESGFVCYEHLSGGLGPLGGEPVESIGGDKLCHKECISDSDCPTNTPKCIVKKRSTEDYVEGFRLCFSEEK